MKKTYQKPETKAIEIQSEQFIATSGDSTPQAKGVLNDGDDWD